MKCSQCNANEASIHFEGVINGKHIHFHLCPDCARANDIPVGEEKPSFSVVDLIANLSDWEVPGHNNSKAVSCPVCGLSYHKFKETARLGCPECYHSFGLQLEPLLKRLHGTSKHAGKRPGEHIVEEADEIHRLRRQLEQAVLNEEYERAAQLRDSIRKMTQNEIGLT